jgi:hypothetical protein
MRSVTLALLLALIAGPAWADEIPTENGDGGEQAGHDAPAGDPGGERIGGYPDGGTSEPGYSNPDGKWTDSAGNTQYDPGHSQDWYEGTDYYGGEPDKDRGTAHPTGGMNAEKGHGSGDGGRGRN